VIETADRPRRPLLSTCARTKKIGSPALPDPPNSGNILKQFNFATEAFDASCAALQNAEKTNKAC
jgi:hypothetical protein